MRRVDVQGEKYGLLLIVGEAPQRGWHRYVIVQCDCGTEKEVKLSHVREGRIVSCGCHAKSRATTHGRSGSSLYSVWQAMKQRCTNEKDKYYCNYGARGIRVCENWLLSFENFTADMGPRPDGGELERMNNDGDYEPSNCKWATRFEQSRNKRNNVIITFDGQTMCLKDWALRLGIHPRTLYTRVKRGWSVADALTRAVRFKGTQ